jgi:hypothetical protein
MHLVITYDVDETINRASISQYLYTVHLRPKLPVFIMLPVFLIFFQLIDFLSGDWLSIGIGVAIFFLAIMWVKTYFLMQAQGRDGLKLLSHPTITITLSDDLLEYSSSTGIPDMSGRKSTGFVRPRTSWCSIPARSLCLSFRKRP